MDDQSFRLGNRKCCPVAEIWNQTSTLDRVVTRSANCSHLYFVGRLELRDQRDRQLVLSDTGDKGRGAQFGAVNSFEQNIFSCCIGSVSVANFLGYVALD